MNRRGVVNVLLYSGLAILFVVSVLASLLTYLHVAAVGLEPTRAFATSVENSDIVETLGDGWWPSITVVGESSPGSYETVTVAAGWWLISPLLVIALAGGVVVWRHGRRRTTAALGPVLEDTQPIPATRGT